MAARRVFAIDLGGSGGKCFVGVFEKDQFSLKEIYRFDNEWIPLYIEDSGGRVSERRYWDDLYLYREIIKGLRIYRQEIDEFLDSIGVDAWGTDGIVVTGEGDFLGRVYCYRDHRLDHMIEEVKERIDAERIYGITGIHFQPFNISNQLLWFILHRRDLLQPGCTYLPTPAIFSFYLGNVRVVDSTMASVTQLMDAYSRQWSTEILRKLSIPADLMPEIVTPGTIVGELLEPLAASVRLNRVKTVAVGSHDTASAYAAAPVADKDEALIISSGTWSLVGKLISEPITTPEAMAANMSNEGGIGDIRFLKNCMGLWLVQELRRTWRIADGREMGWGEMRRLVTDARPFTAFVDPDDRGFYNPSNMEEALTDFCKRTNQQAPKDRGTYLRVVYESLALKYRTVAEEICRICGKPNRVVHIVGGGCRNEMLNQLTANATGLPVFSGPEEATAIGNILVQALGLRIIEGLEVAPSLIRQGFDIKKYDPNDTRLWEREYERFSNILASRE